MLRNEEAPAWGVKTQGRGEVETTCTAQFIERRAKRKNGNVWYEEGGRYFWKYSPQGSTCFDTWFGLASLLGGAHDRLAQPGSHLRLRHAVRAEAGEATSLLS